MPVEIDAKLSGGEFDSILEDGGPDYCRYHKGNSDELQNIC